MAKQEKELTVEERLKSLYQLQTMLSEIDRIKILRGELPLEVQDLEDEIAGLETRISNYEADEQQLKEQIAEQHAIVDKAAQLIDQYTRQQNEVSNNKEYDYLSKEIEFQSLNVESADKKINEANRHLEALQESISASRTQLEESKQLLGEKKGELDEIIAETKQDEEKLREKAKKLEAKFDDQRLLEAFKRIRRNTRNGLGLVYVQRNACGGCFNRIPAQRQMEIKMHKKIIVCEYCGRILVDPELAGITNVDAKNA